MFFKDGKFFFMGEEIWVDGIFLLLLSVIYGVLWIVLMVINYVFILLEDSIENIENLIISYLVF